MMLGLAIAIGTCIILGATATLWFRLKTERLRRSRPLMAMTQFVSRFAQTGVPADVSEAVYQYLATLPLMHDFPVDPSDRLLTAYGVEGEELVDAYRSILETLGRELPEARNNDAMTVDTVEELVRFINDLPAKVVK